MADPVKRIRILAPRTKEQAYHLLALKLIGGKNYIMAPETYAKFKADKIIGHLLFDATPKNAAMAIAVNSAIENYQKY